MTSNISKHIIELLRHVEEEVGNSNETNEMAISLRPIASLHKAMKEDKRLT